MKIRKIITLLLATVLFVSCVTNDSKPDGADITVPSENNVLTQELLPSSSNVKLLGRAYFDSEVLWMGYSSTGAEFEVNAKRLDVTIAGDGAAPRATDQNAARIVIFVNDERKVDHMMKSKEQTFTLFDSVEAVNAVVRILKVSEASSSFAGIKKLALDESGSIKPTAEKSVKIEFIGDSITCGYGVDDLVKEHHFATSTEDNTKTYAYKTAQALDADYSMVSVSGWGIISGYTGDGTKNTGSVLPPVYEKYAVGYGHSGKSALQNMTWDFSNFIPDVVVVNLGTNDASYTKGNDKKIAEYQSGYVSFLKKIRSYNPDAKIVCSLGIMGQDLYGAIEAAVAEYTAETGDSNVTALKFANQSMADGIAADWHPSEKTHQKAAAVLTAKIKEILK